MTMKPCQWALRSLQRPGIARNAMETHLGMSNCRVGSPLNDVIRCIILRLEWKSYDSLVKALPAAH